MENSTTLAIDFGTKRIGLAITHGSLAEPLTIVENNETAISQIAKLIQERRVEQVVVGVSEQEMARKTKEFGQQLAKVVSVPIHFFDETLSSQEVAERLRQQGIKASKRQGPIDHYAAAVILEEWLEQQPPVDPLDK